jgi:hypothetical protein
LSGITEIHFGQALIFSLSVQYDAWANATHIAATLKTDNENLAFIQSFLSEQLF